MVVSGCETLARKHGEIGPDESPEFPRGTEQSIGDGPLGLELLNHRGEPRLPVRRRSLDVDQARHRDGEPELVLQPRDVHLRADPAVALPVQADEDVGLCEVGPVQLPRRVRLSSQLEENGRESKRGNGARHGDAFLGELGQGRAHEDAQTLVRCPNHPDAPASALICPSWEDRNSPRFASSRQAPARRCDGRRHPPHWGGMQRDGSVVGVIAWDPGAGCGAADANCEPIPS